LTLGFSSGGGIGTIGGAAAGCSMLTWVLAVLILGPWCETPTSRVKTLHSMPMSLLDIFGEPVNGNHKGWVKVTFLNLKFVFFFN
jgi:hypothetical protein